MFVRRQKCVLGGGVAISQPLELHLAHGGLHEASVPMRGLGLLQFGLSVQVSCPTQNGESAFFHTGARLGQVLKAQFLAQHVVAGFGQDAAFTRPQGHLLALITEIFGNHAVGRVVKAKQQTGEFSASV